MAGPVGVCSLNTPSLECFTDPDDKDVEFLEVRLRPPEMGEVRVEIWTFWTCGAWGGSA